MVNLQNRYQNKTSRRIATACVYYILCIRTSLNKIIDLTKTSFFEGLFHIHIVIPGPGVPVEAVIGHQQC